MDILNDLDIILKYYGENGIYVDNVISQKELGLFLEKHTGKELNPMAIDLCLNQLIKDEYIEAFHEGFRVTVKGLLFILKTGGYTQQQKDSNRDRTIQIIHQWLLSTGTILAGLYSLFLFAKWFFAHFCSCQV